MHTVHLLLCIMVLHSEGRVFLIVVSLLVKNGIEYTVNSCCEQIFPRNTNVPTKWSVELLHVFLFVSTYADMFHKLSNCLKSLRTKGRCSFLMSKLKYIRTKFLIYLSISNLSISEQNWSISEQQNLSPKYIRTKFIQDMTFKTN